MSSCDAEAANDLPKIYFLVVPLLAANPNDGTWSAKAFDKAGTTILLSSEDALAGLRNGTLRLNDGPFTFSVLDPTTNAVYTWKSKVGASKLASTDAAAINTFKVRAFKGEEPGGADWSSDFTRHQGSCHWVNVLIAP
jgi:hypothetical protein